MILEETRDDAALHTLDDVLFAGTIDEEEHGQFAVDLSNMAFKDDLCEDRTDEGFTLDVCEQTSMSDSISELDDVQMPGGKLANAAFAQVDVGKVAKDALVLQTLALSSNGPHARARRSGDGAVACSGVANEGTQDGTLVGVEGAFRGHGAVSEEKARRLV